MKYRKQGLYSIHVAAKASAQCIDGSNAAEDGLCAQGPGVSGGQLCNPGMAASSNCMSGTAPARSCTSTGNGTESICFTGNNPAVL